MCDRGMLLQVCRQLADVRAGNGTDLHSDGVGLITMAGMEAVMRRFPAYRRGNMALPSAIQIRFGGAKGMLTLWDER